MWNIVHKAYKCLNEWEFTRETMSITTNIKHEMSYN